MSLSPLMLYPIRAWREKPKDIWKATSIYVKRLAIYEAGEVIDTLKHLGPVEDARIAPLSVGVRQCRNGLRIIYVQAILSQHFAGKILIIDQHMIIMFLALDDLFACSLARPDNPLNQDWGSMRSPLYK